MGSFRAKVEGVTDPEQFLDDEGGFDGCYASCGDKEDVCAVGLAFVVCDECHFRERYDVSSSIHTYASDRSSFVPDVMINIFVTIRKKRTTFSIIGTTI